MYWHVSSVSDIVSFQDQQRYQLQLKSPEVQAIKQIQQSGVQLIDHVLAGPKRNLEHK